MKFSRIFLNTTTDFIRQSFKRISGILSYPESSIYPRIFSLSLFIFLSLSLLFALLSLQILLTRSMLVYLRLTRSSRPPRKGHPDLEWVHSRVSRKNHISTFLVHQARRVFSASSVRNFLFARSSYFFASPSWKGYRGYRDNLICQN